MNIFVLIQLLLVLHLLFFSYLRTFPILKKIIFFLKIKFSFLSYQKFHVILFYVTYLWLASAIPVEGKKDSLKQLKGRIYVLKALILKKTFPVTRKYTETPE